MTYDGQVDREGYPIELLPGVKPDRMPPDVAPAQVLHIPVAWLRQIAADQSDAPDGCWLRLVMTFAPPEHAMVEVDRWVADA